MNEKKNIIIFTDVGDTIVDEETQVRDENGIVTTAELIPTAREAYQQLYEEGYIIAMVADGEVQSFGNIVRVQGIDHWFTSNTISEIVGVQKPEAPMFQSAMDKLRLTDEDKPRIIMVGNNLKKDIAGANDYGLTSIWLTWSPRYYQKPEEPNWVPDYSIDWPSELVDLVHKLEEEYADK